MIKKIRKSLASVLTAALILTLFIGLAPADRTKAAGNFNVYLGNYDTRIYAGGINDIEIYTDLPAGTEVTYQWQCGYDSWSGSGKTWVTLDDNDKWKGTKTAHLQYLTDTGEGSIDNGWDDFDFRCIVHANGSTKTSTPVRMSIYPTDKIAEDLKYDKITSFTANADGALYLTSIGEGEDLGTVYAGSTLTLSMDYPDLSKYTKYAQSEVKFSPEIVFLCDGKKTIANYSPATFTPLQVGTDNLVITFRLCIQVNGVNVGVFQKKTMTFSVLKPPVIAQGTANYDFHTLAYPYNEARQLDEVKKGSTVNIVYNGGTWYKIFTNGRVGYVPSTAITLKDTEHKAYDCTKDMSNLTYHASVPATCTEPGTDEYYVCKKCGRVYLKEGSSSFHLVVDSNDLTISPKGHEWDDWVRIKEPTETEEGIEERVCFKDPSHKEQRSVPKLDSTAPGVRYRSYVQKKGWLPWVSNGAFSGTKGESLRMEAMKIGLTDASGSVRYRAYVQKEGWQAWKQDEAMCGTTGENKRLEAVQIKLDGNVSLDYNIWYRVYAQKFGWMGWTANGQSSGTSGYGYRLEGIQIKLLPRTQAAPGKTDNSYNKKQ